MTNTKNNQYTKSIGGKVLASGGFGCVFSPALKCQNKPKEKNKITKLMTEKHAIEEYNEIINIKKKIDKIPNYHDYFLVDDFHLCRPEKLSKDDLMSFKKKCTALPKNDITIGNINNSLEKVMALNMPNGGIPVDDYVYDNGSFEKLIHLNDSLINLLNNGIIPMNEKNIYHCDIKDSNVLVDVKTTNVKTRLIDWGLSIEYTPYKDEKFPKTWRNRPLQFNVPFSVIIFTDYFLEKYTKYIKNGGKVEKEYLKSFVSKYIVFWIKKRGLGHYKFINSIMYMLYFDNLPDVNQKEKVRIIEREYTLKLINEYIVEILIHFTKFRENGTLNLREYLDNVFIKITDIWGFIMVYYPILELLFDNHKNLTSNQLNIFNEIKEIIIEYCYKPRITPIDINELSSKLHKLNDLFNKEHETEHLSKNMKLSENNIKQYIPEKFNEKTVSYLANNNIISFKKSYSKSLKKIGNLLLMPKRNYIGNSRNKTKKLNKK